MHWTLETQKTLALEWSMAFTDEELQAIRAALDPLCERVPLHVRDQVRMAYDVDRLGVILFEERPDWRGGSEWMRHPIAKFRYYRRRDEWELYWQRADLKWHLYEPGGPARRLATLVRHVDRDQYGCFFG